MFDRLRSFFNRPAPAPEQHDATQLAVAALLVEAARADENYEEREKTLIDAALIAQFGLQAGAAAELRAEGEAAQAKAVDLHRFTKVVKAISLPEKIRLVESLWAIVLSDDRRDPHEDALIRRLCGLIYVSDPDSGAARQRAAEALKSRGSCEA